MPSKSENADEVHRRVVFHGRVQGVGFRYTTQSLAREFAVGGYVKNLADGTVELAVSGRPDQVDRLLQAVRSHWEDNLTNVVVEAWDGPRFSVENGLAIRH